MLDDDTAPRKLGCLEPVVERVYLGNRRGGAKVEPGERNTFEASKLRVVPKYCLSIVWPANIRAPLMKELALQQEVEESPKSGCDEIGWPVPIRLCQSA